jgi:hypothetical protein
MTRAKKCRMITLAVAVLGIIGSGAATANSGVKPDDVSGSVYQRHQEVPAVSESVY